MNLSAKITSSLLFILLVSCSDNRDTYQKLLLEQYAELDGLYNLEFLRYYTKCEDLDDPKSKKGFDKMIKLYNDHINLKKTYYSHKKENRMKFILKEREHLKKLGDMKHRFTNHPIEFINLDMISEFNDTLFNTAILTDFSKAHTEIMRRFYNVNHQSVIKCTLGRHSRNTE